MQGGWLRLPHSMWLATLLALGDVPVVAAEPASPEARYEAALAAWRSAAEPDGEALLDAFVALPDFARRMEGIDAAIVASMVEDEAGPPAALAVVEEALVRAPASLALHARAMALAADLEDPARAAQAERAVTSLATAYAASGDGTSRRPWRVLGTTDAAFFVALRGGEVLGRRFARGGGTSLLVLYVSEETAGNGVTVAEHAFSLRAFERLEPVLSAQGMPAFARYSTVLAAFVKQKDIAGASAFMAMVLAAGAEARPEAAALATQLQENAEIGEDLFARTMLASFRVRRDDKAPMPGNGAAPLDELIALAERGLPPAVRELAELIDAGRLPGMEAAEAVALMRAGAERGSPSLAFGLAYGMRKDGNHAEAERWLQRAIDLGSLEAVGQLGWWRLATGPLDEPLAGQVRDAAARGDALSMVVEGLRALRAQDEPERARGRGLLLAAPGNADLAEIGNDVAYELALGTPRAPRDGALAVQVMELNFSIHAYARGKPAHVDTHAVALVAAGRRADGLAMLEQALADADEGTNDTTRFFLERHAARIRAGQDITEATDAEDEALWKARPREKR